MTGGERLAKVAEVLADVDGEYGTNEARAAWVVYFQRHAQALKPLVTEWQAEDEARALREAAAGLEDHAHCDCEEGDHLRLLASPQWLRDRADRIGGGA